jgi:uncharacterized damage-inducible protein DinB
MSELDSIVDEMQKIHDGDAWHGPALRESLAGLSPQQAAARPIASAHSIWEIVRHITVWERVFHRRLGGEPVSEPEEGDFPQPGEINEDLWMNTLAELDAEHEKLLNVVRNLTDAGLERKVVNRDYNVRFQLHAIVRHHVYHAGQIALLRKSFS